MLSCSFAPQSLSACVFRAALDVNGTRSLSDGAPLFSSIPCSPSREGPGIPVSCRQERGAEFGTQISRIWFSNLTVCSGKQTRAGSRGVCVSRDVLSCGFPMAKGLGTPSARAQRWGAWLVTFLSFLPLPSHTQFVKFANIEEDTPSYHRSYDFFVSRFSEMCHSSHEDLEIKTK